MTGYPYFPAEVIDYKLHHDDLPATVLQSEATARRQHKGAPIWLVRFYDHTTSYGWVPEGKMDPLGVDDGKWAWFAATLSSTCSNPLVLFAVGHGNTCDLVSQDARLSLTLFRRGRDVPSSK